MASMFMAFAGLTSGYVVSRKALLQENLWMEFALPNWFLYSTIVIGLSSATMVLAARMIDREDTPNATRMIGITFVLGLIFLLFQYAVGKTSPIGASISRAKAAALLVRGCMPSPSSICCTFWLD